MLYWSGLLAAVQESDLPSIDLDGKCATPYVDRNNAVSELVLADSKASAISTSGRISRAEYRPWFERVRGNSHISDPPPGLSHYPIVYGRLRNSRIGASCDG